MINTKNQQTNGLSGNSKKKKKNKNDKEKTSL